MLVTSAPTTSTSVLTHTFVIPAGTSHSTTSALAASNRSSTGAIVGGVVGAGGLIILLVAFFMVRIECRWKFFLSYSICSVEFVNKEA